MRTTILPPTNPRHPAAATHLQTRPVGSADGCTSRASFLCEFLLVTPGTPAVPAVPAVGREGEQGYVPAVAAVPAGPAQVESLLAGNVAMTPEQWAAYPAGGTADSDASYEHACVLRTLGVTAA